MTSKKNVYVIETPLQYLYTIATINVLRQGNNIVFWFGRKKISEFFPVLINSKQITIIDCTKMDLSSWKGFHNNHDRFLNLAQSNFDNINYLFTCYDTHYAFEILHNYYSVSWNRIGIIEDGLANYYPHNHPDTKNQIPKALINFLKNGYFLNISRYNLGGNPKIGFLSSICPDHIFIHNNSKAEIIDIKSEFLTLLDVYESYVPKIYEGVDVLFFLGSIFNYNRMNQKQLINFLKFVQSNFDDFDKFIIKPHPRDDREKLEKAIINGFGKDVILAEQRPIEIYFKKIMPKIIAGSNSTAILNHHIINPNSQTKYFLFPISYTKRDHKFNKVKMKVFRKIIKDITIKEYGLPK